jgi:23S rRNA (cytidine1920-2'-O)/16S rRNA (cytidine1409-2'-O)-methyltransferase
MKECLDIVLVDRRLVESRAKAQWLIKSGFVFVNDIKILKSSKRVDINSKINLTKKYPYVGRGGLKLEAALKSFSVDVTGKICVDIGASVGGFTDCLLQHGALKGVDITTVDVTFSSLKSILPNVKNYLKQDGDIIVLVKPLFETNFHQEKKFKIVKDSTMLKKILREFIIWSKMNSLYPKGLLSSPLLGKGGSIEFLVHLRIDKEFIFKTDNTIDEILKDVKDLNSNYLDSF